MHCASGVIPSILVRYAVGMDRTGMITCLYRNKVDDNIVSNILSCPQLGLLELRFAQGRLYIPNK